MGEPKAFASLSSGLLARKGAARPAMKPQGFGQVGSGLEDLGWNDMGFEPPKPAIAPVRDEDHDAFGEELSDQPLRNPIAALTPIASPVHDQQAEIAERFAAHDEDGEDDRRRICRRDRRALRSGGRGRRADVRARAAPVVVIPQSCRCTGAGSGPSRAGPRAAPGSKGKSAFTLRLDPARHLKLRLACAVAGRSAQQLVTDALDQLLDGMPELDSMAERAPRKERLRLRTGEMS